MKIKLSHTCSFQEEETQARVANELAVRTEALERTLAERQEEMKLAIEERELQKMAAVGEKDSRNDELYQMVENIKTVRTRLQSVK